MKRVLRTLASRRDFLQIWRHIAKDNAHAADRVLAAIEERIRLVATHPEAGRPREEFAAGLRSFTIGKYLVFYRYESDSVQIIRILHAARNLASILKRKPQ